MVARFRHKCKTAQEALNQLSAGSLDQSELNQLTEDNVDDNDDTLIEFSDNDTNKIDNESLLNIKEEQQDPISDDLNETTEKENTAWIEITNESTGEIKHIESYEEVEYLDGTTHQITINNTNSVIDEEPAESSTEKPVQYIVMDDITEENDIFSDIIEECQTSDTDKNVIVDFLNGENKYVRMLVFV